ncbi:uncharacterized protein EV420DRAFT_473502 [Desarmillaria tabescens]|uniref:Uncharacterized protein n=1 Tax=Armillaria tabescens TaxID=1929756 RepID=A0AA39KAU8_ARMTA|nr:uncharacterized protein EV420DRAFT_473502 [Desarmillaria tabescens]KAK0457690.1 hypothetical protein EV420DRAFT_473502 [Desarmillaria tabescens]
MYPYPSYHYFYRWHRRPSRLLWFVLGAGAATLFMKHREAARVNGKFYWGHCQRHSVNYGPVPPQSRIAQWREETENWKPTPPPAVPVGNSVYEGNYSSGWREQEWDAEKEKMKAFGKQAQDAMTDMSEATLDSLLATVTALKQKLAQHRAQREQQEKLLEEEIEQHKKHPPRFV